MNRYKQIRSKWQITQEQAAVFVGVSRLTWHRWEQEITEPQDTKSKYLITKLENNSPGDNSDVDRWVTEVRDNKICT